MDYLRMRDGRNMYGARGGYSSRRMRRDRRDRAAMDDRNYEPDYRERIFAAVDFCHRNGYRPATLTSVALEPRI